MNKLHYRLSNDEWLALVARLKLNFAEVKVLLHLRTIDPFGDKFKDADTKDIAENLEIHQRTVQKALCTLAAKELIDLEIGKFKFRLRSQLAASTPPDDLQTAIQDIELAASTPPDDLQTASGGVQGAEAAHRPFKRRTGRDRSLEPSQSKGSKTPQTNKTLLDSSDSFKEEREIRARAKKTVENSSSASDSANKSAPFTNGSIQKTESALARSLSVTKAVAESEFDLRVWANSKNLDTEERQAFWVWLKKRVSKMPNPPANPAQVARNFIRTDGDDLLQQFREETNAAKQSAITTTTSRSATLTFTRQTGGPLPTYQDLSDQIAFIQQHLKLKQWGWGHPQINLWACNAQEYASRYQWPPIDFKPALGLTNWPDWAIAQLALDLKGD